jgi:hypothetical protein
VNFPARKKVSITVEAIAWMTLWSAKLGDFPGIRPPGKHHQGKNLGKSPQMIVGIIPMVVGENIKKILIVALCWP